MCIEKFIALYLPLLAKRICTVQIARWVCLVIMMVYILVNIYSIFLVKTGTSVDGSEMCEFADDYYWIFSYVDFALYTLVPFIIMCVANSLIIYKLGMSKYKSRFGNSQAINQALSKSSLKGVTMLVAVSLTFLILTLPICLVSVGILSSVLTETLAILLSFLNHSINGFVYCIFGSMFRKELFKLLCKCRQNKVDVTASDSNSGGNTVSTA